MIFVTGPLYAGKRTYVRTALDWDDAAFSDHAIWDVQELVDENTDLEALAESLSSREVVIATEVGGGLVPIDPAERFRREAAGRLSCLLAARADTVIRVCCGLPQCLKGSLP